MSPKAQSDTGSKFNKNLKTFSTPGKFSRQQLVIFAAIFAVVGGFIIWKTFAATTFTPRDLHTHRLEVDANSYDPSSGTASTNNYQFVWGKFQSPSTEGSAEREIVWAPGHKYEGRKAYVVWSFKPVQGRKPGRMLNFHTHPQWGGWTPDNSSGVSSIALDWFGDTIYEGNPAGLSITLENHVTGKGHYTLVPVSVLDDAMANGKWIDIVLEIGLNTSSNGGYIKGWVNGNDTPAVNVSNIGTVWPSQTGVYLWEGMYNSSGAGETNRAEFVPARVGRTLDEALNDNPTEFTIDGSYSKSNNQPSFRHISTGTRSTGLFMLPPSLGAATSSPVPTLSPPPPSSTTTISISSSSVVNGGTYPAGTNWTASFSTTPSLVEFWADGAKISEDTSAPFSSTINLAEGVHKVGLCATVSGARTCFGASGVYGSITVTAPTIKAPTVTISASPTTAISGSSSTLSWNATDSTTCTSSGAWSGIKSATGSETVTPSSTSTYSISCTGAGGSANASVIVNVSVPPPPTVTSSNVINGSAITSGTVWTTTFSTTPSSVEFWANGSRIITDTVAPFSTTLNLNAGTHQLGLCATIGGTRTCFGNNGVYATITVTVPTVSAPAVTSSNIKEGSTVVAGTTWTVGITPAPSSVEFFADGTKLTTDATSPYSTVLNLSQGKHQVGLCATVSGARTCFGTGGIYANIAVTGDTSAPTAPTNLTVTASSKYGVSLSWKASTDNIGVKGYKVFENGTSKDNGSALTYSTSALLAKTAYTYYVVAYDAAGNTSAASQKVCLGKWGLWNTITRSRSWENC